MAKNESFYSRWLVFSLSLLLAFILFPAQVVFAKRPPEIRNQEDLNITQDMHDQDLSGYEFVKFDLRGINFSGSNLSAAVFNNSNLSEADLSGSDMHDSLAYASNFENADLSNVDFTNSLLMESSFDNAKIDGADFSDAVLSRIQQKQLCSIASGSNSVTGVETSYSLGC